MCQVSARPGPSQPTGRVPEALLDAVERGEDRVAFALRVHLVDAQRVGLAVADQLPAEAGSASSTISGWWSQTSLLSAVLARMP